jgi:hypothetical protein
VEPQRYPKAVEKPRLIGSIAGLNIPMCLRATNRPHQD